MINGSPIRAFIPRRDCLARFVTLIGPSRLRIAQRDAVPALRERLLTEFYEPAGLPDGIIECTPAAGSCLVGLSDSHTVQHRDQERLAR